MNYSRYNRRYVPQKNQKPRGKYGEIIIIAILLGVAAYFITAGVAGQWLANNVLSPFLSDPQTTITPTPTQSASSAGEGSAKPSATVTEDMDIPGFTIYSLQLGAFSSRDNADVQAEAVKKQGGAGYVIDEKDLHRVIAAAYTIQSDAEAVKNALAQQASIDSSIYSISAEGVSLSVTANKDRIEALHAGFTAYLGVKDKMAEISMKYDTDANNSDLTQSITEQKDILTGQKEALKNLKDTNNAILPQMENLLDEAIAQLDKVLNAPDDKSSRAAILKFAHISIVNNYVEFVKKINN